PPFSAFSAPLRLCVKTPAPFLFPSPMATSLQVILNGELIPAAQAKISPLSDGFLFGHGVFETLRARHGQALQLEAHHARLAASCLALGLDAPDSPDELGQRITRLLAALKLPQA